MSESGSEPGSDAGGGDDAGTGDRVWDAGLQPERTALSWRRTGLAMLGGSLLLARALAEVSVPLALTVGALGIATAVATLIALERRYRSHHRRLTSAAGERIPLAGGGLPLVVAAATTLLGGGAAMAAILLSLRVS
jgi:putative membrane protein